MNEINNNMIPEDISTLGFEESFKLLEDVVASLEVGGLALKQAVDLYQQGMSLTQHCSNLLNQVELQITNIKQDYQEN
jgi:exodeoxyribonuclease VII small subunit